MLELRKRERERKLILKIDLSLKDIEDDLYGYCETCGIEIDKETRGETNRHSMY